jgi:hypothetical protein
MPQLQLRKAKRSQVYLKMGIASPSGGGKTAGALLIAYGLLKEKHPQLSDAEIWDKVAIVDTENGSGELYVNHDIGMFHIGEYSVVRLDPPFTTDLYVGAIEICEKSGIEVAILDSTTHLWQGEGGLLEQQSVAASKSGNSYTAWRNVTPEHNRFVDKMLQSKLHIIATMRSKTAHEQDVDEKGKKIVRKLGLKPIQREGMEYEFTLFLDIDENHKASVSKDRTSLFDGKQFKVTPDVGSKLMNWLSSEDAAKEDKVIAEVQLQNASPEDGAKKNKLRIKELASAASPEVMEKYKEIWKRFEPKEGNPNAVKDAIKQAEMLSEMEQLSLETA